MAEQYQEGQQVDVVASTATKSAVFVGQSGTITEILPDNGSGLDYNVQLNGDNRLVLFMADELAPTPAS